MARSRDFAGSADAGHRRQTHGIMIGGAGNVARNLVALGTRCIFIGAVGDDDAGDALTKALGNHPLIEFHLVVDGTRQTTRKVRFVSEHHSTHMLRADWETASAVDARSEDALIGHVIKAMPRAGAVVLSDYAKGALTPRVIRAVIDAANARRKPVVVDPKGRDYSIYRGATVVTPNRQELADATHSRRGQTMKSPMLQPNCASIGRKGGAGDAQRGRNEPW